MEPNQKRLAGEAYRADEIEEEEEIRDEVSSNKREDAQPRVYVESCRVSHDGQEWYVVTDEKTPATRREITIEAILAMESTHTRLLYYDAILAFKRDRMNGA